MHWCTARLPHVWVSIFVSLNVLLLSCHFNFFSHGGALISYSKQRQNTVPIFVPHGLTLALTHVYHIWPLKENLNCRRVIFWPSVFVFWQYQRHVADSAALLSHSAKIWNWRIIVSPRRVAVLSSSVDFSIPLTFVSAKGKFVFLQIVGTVNFMQTYIFYLYFYTTSCCVYCTVLQRKPLPSIFKTCRKPQPSLKIRVSQISGKNAPLVL